jgi:hypothetical protein
MATRHRRREAILLVLTIISLGVAIWQGIEAHFAFIDAKASNEKLVDAVNQLNVTQTDLGKARADNEALEGISLPGFLKQYDAHITTLKTATEAYDTAKVAKGADIPGSDAASELVHAESELYAEVDNFTDFVDRWRKVRDVFDKMLDGNVTQLKNLRRVNNTVDVNEMARRIIKEAPDLAEPLRIVIDGLKAASSPH